MKPPKREWEGVRKERRGPTWIFCPGAPELPVTPLTNKYMFDGDFAGDKGSHLPVYRTSRSFSSLGGLVVEFGTCYFQVTVRISPGNYLQATLNKWLICGVLRATQPPTLSRAGDE